MKKGKKKIQRLAPQQIRNHTVKIIEIDEGDIYKREEIMARLIFLAAQRKLRNSQGISPLQKSLVASAKN